MGKELSLSSVVTRNPDLVARSIDNDLVILHPGTGEYYGTASSGNRIWQLIEQPTPISKLVDMLISEVDAERVVIEADVLEFLRAMLDEDLIIICDD